MVQQNRPRSVRASARGIERLNQAKESKRDGNGARLSLAKIAEQAYVEETTVKRFFRGERIYTDNAEAICQVLGLDLVDIVDPEEFNQFSISNGTQITLTGSLDQVKPQLDKILEDLRKNSGDQTVTIRITKEGSVIIIIDGSYEGLKRLESLFKAGELKSLAGFPIEDVRPEWEDKSVNLSRWFENIFTAGWQSVEELLTPQQLSPTVWSDRVKQGKLFNLRADLISHAVNLVINLTRASEDKVSVWLQVYPSGENYLPLNLKLLVLAEGEVFKEVTARSADVLIQCQFDADPGDEFTVKLALGEVSVTEKFVL